MAQYGFDYQLQIYGGSLSGKKPEFPIGTQEWERAARQQLADGPWGYVAGGAGAEDTMRENVSAFQKWKIRPRMLINVDHRDLTIEIFGRTLQSPFLLAPIGVQSIIHPDAEIATAKAAANMNVPFILSTVSSVSIESIAQVMGTSPRWFQLYPGKDPEIISSFINRAEAAGFEALVITVDTTMLGWRETDLKNAYLPFLHGEGIANFISDSVFRRRLRQTPEENLSSAIAEFLSVYVNPAFTWDDLKTICQLTKLPVLVKGITHVEDAKKAASMGIHGLIVSNHGGRQVDGAISALDSLVQIREELGDSMTILFDSGLRHASDVVKALSLGAQAVLIGRPYAYALAVGGQKGVETLLKQWTAELDLQLALSGICSIAELNRSHLISMYAR